MRPLSHSSMYLYGNCPKRWHFKYIEKIPEKPKHFFSFGKSMHSVLEYFYDVQTLPPPDLEQVLKNYEENWLTEGYQNAAQEADYKAQGERILREYYAKHIDRFRIPYFVEYGFNLEVDGIKVVGYIDRIDKLDDGTLSVVDYKTGKAIPKARVAQDQQLTMYQMACEELLGLKVSELTFYHLTSQTALTVGPHKKEQIDVLREKIVNTAEQIKAEKFDPRPEERKCGWCDYKPLCPVFKHQFARQSNGADEERPALRSDEKLAKLVDRYGKMKEEIHEREEKADEVKAAIIDTLRAKGYVRAFGSRYEATAHFDDRWEFADKNKVKETIMDAGFWERIVAPSAPAVQKLMKDPNLPLDLKDRLQRLGKKVSHATLRVKKTEVEDE